MENHSGLLDVREIARIPNKLIRKLCGMKNGVEKRNGESILKWFVHVVKMLNIRISRRIYMGECMQILPSELIH